MPKNTYFIKENYKKVEEVREIDNKVPSFEEFMENYEFDERVVDSYKDEINRVNVWTPKGVGPCRWNNPRCSCQYDERWMDLRMNCQTCGRVLTHTCGGQLEISNKARIQCKGCGDVSNAKYFGFSCSNHGRSYTDLASLTDVAIMALECGNVNKIFVTKLLQNLKDSYRN